MLDNVSIGLVVGCIGFCLLGILVAVGPVFYMTYHSCRYGHLASQADGAPVLVPTTAEAYDWSEPPEYQAVVTNEADREEATPQLVSV